MKFEYTETISHPLDEVYPVIRDKLPEMVRFLPEVESIETISREELGPGRVKMVNVWQANAGAAPAVARPFLSKKMTRWRDHATWIDEEHKVEWTFETFYFDRLYDCSGFNTFEAVDDKTTVIRIVGSLVIYPEKVRGVPKILMRKVAPRIEAYLIDTVTPNLAQLPLAVQAYLDREEEEE